MTDDRPKRFQCLPGGSRPACGEGSSDAEILEVVMKLIRKIERQTGKVPTIEALAFETGVSLTRLKVVISKLLPDVSSDGCAESMSSLKRQLICSSGGVLDDLTQKGLISRRERQRVLREQERTGEPVDLILARLGLASEYLAKNALESQYGVNFVALRKVETIPPGCLQLLPEAVMRQQQLVVLEIDGNRATVAMVNPDDQTALDDIKMRLMGMRVKLSVCTEEDFHWFMDKFYSEQGKSDEKVEGKTARDDPSELCDET
jgi:hypothetical protein